jgi:predicted N-acetyltransferase YhbS
MAESAESDMRTPPAAVGRAIGEASGAGDGERRGRLSFKVAEEPWEFEQVYGLNYRTFVEEIPQHEPNAERRLVDRLLAGSTCFVALEGRRVVGMVAIRGERPFSLDRKLPDLDRYLPAGARPCEVRLLAVPPDRRGGLVFAGLFRRLLQHARERGYDVAVISAALSQIRLYRHVGFEPFGPPLGTSGAPYQGMLLTWELLTPSGFRLLEAEGEP